MYTPFLFSSHVWNPHNRTGHISYVSLLSYTIGFSLQKVNPCEITVNTKQRATVS